MGEPYRFNEKCRQRYLGCLRSGLRRGAAARAAGISRYQVWVYCKQHPDFAQECEEAEVMVCEPVEDALRRKALDGNIVAIKFWLCNRCPDRWREDKRTPTVINDLQPAQAEPYPHNADELRARLEQAIKDRLIQLDEEEADDRHLGNGRAP
jgi:hypothetical protein